MEEEGLGRGEEVGGRGGGSGESDPGFSVLNTNVEDHTKCMTQDMLHMISTRCVACDFRLGYMSMHGGDSPQRNDCKKSQMVLSKSLLVTCVSVEVHNCIATIGAEKQL